MPYGYSVKDVDIQSVAISKINGDIIISPLKAVGRPYYTHFFWSRVRHLTAKFDRQALISLLEETDRSITVSGELKDGTKFSGTGRIVAINPGHHRNHIFWKYNALLQAFQIWNLR